MGLAKINAANQIGGRTLALRTVKDLTGLDVNHVVFVDFDRFEELVDAVGGSRSTSREDPLEQVRLPVQDRRAVREVEGLALRPRRAAHGRQARARLFRASAATSLNPPRPTSTGRGGSSRSSPRRSTR